MAISTDKISEKIYETVTARGDKVVPGLAKGLSRESIEDLKKILENLEIICAEDAKNLSVEATFAYNPSKDVMDDLLKQLEKDLGRKVLVVTRVEPKIIGGLILKIGDMVVDNSVMTRVGELSKKLKTKKATE